VTDLHPSAGTVKVNWKLPVVEFVLDIVKEEVNCVAVGAVSSTDTKFGPDPMSVKVPVTVTDSVIPAQKVRVWSLVGERFEIVGGVLSTENWTSWLAV
jgi:hypothetical protein